MKIWCALEEEQKRLESARSSFDVQNDSFNELCKYIDSLIARECSLETLASERLVVSSQFGKFKESHSNYVSIAPEKVSKQLMLGLSDCIARFNTVQAKIDGYIALRKVDRKGVLFEWKRCLCPDSMDIYEVIPSSKRILVN